MAKKVEVWATRFQPPKAGTPPYGPFYMLYPFEPQPWTEAAPDRDATWVSSREFEALWPQCALQPGGGPVRVR